MEPPPCRITTSCQAASWCRWRSSWQGTRAAEAEAEAAAEAEAKAAEAEAEAEEEVEAATEAEEEAEAEEVSEVLGSVQAAAGPAGRITQRAAS